MNLGLKRGSETVNLSKVTILLGNLSDSWGLINFCAGNDGTIIAMFEGPGFNDKFALKYGEY